jgi:cysteine desulfurase
MTRRVVYLDNAATTPVDPRVASEMAACLEPDGIYANPSSVHGPGRAARALVEKARADVAALVGAEPAQVIFTSGATESDNLALLGSMRFQRDQRRHVITSRTEHPAVLDACRQLEREGCAVTYLKPGVGGIVAPSQVVEAWRADTRLVSLMHVNNEIGVVQDVATIGRLCHERGALFHVDAAQSAGKLPIDMPAMHIDLLSLTAHKIHGPKGIGALCVRREPRVGLVPLQFGGGQERGLRSGTLPTHQVVGLGAAFRIARLEGPADATRVAGLRDRLRSALEDISGIETNGDPVRRVAGILNVSIDGVEGESLLYALRDLAVSSGSACASTNAEPSYVLRALGRSDRLAQSSLRLSLGRFTTDAEVDYAAGRIGEEVTRLRRGMPAPSTAPSGLDDDARYATEVAKRFQAMTGAQGPVDALRGVTGAAGDREHGAAVELRLEVRGGRVVAAGFSAFGCPHLVAAASWVTERMVGLSQPELETWDWQAAAQALQVPPAKFGRLLTLQDAVRAAARNWPADTRSTL